MHPLRNNKEDEEIEEKKKRLFKHMFHHSPISLPCVKTLDISVFSDLDDNVFKRDHGSPECRPNEAKVSCRVKDARLWVELLTGISKVKSLSLETGNVGRQGELTLQILKCCPELENISIEEVEGVEWNAPAEAIPFCMERNLKTLKFTVTTINGALGYEFDAQLVKYLLAHSEVLNKLTVAFDPMVAKEDEETLCAELMRIKKKKKKKKKKKGGRKN
ncbi:FBD-like protein [Tanacetum coccineum]